MGIFSRAKNKSELVLVFDIGSGKVGGSLFWMKDSGTPEIIFTAVEQIPLEANFDIDRFLSLTIQSLEVVAERVSSAGLGVPKGIFCVLSSPWHISQTRIINFQKNTPFIFTAKLAESLVQKEINIFEEEHSIKNVDASNFNRIIELKNIKTILNGYETPEPLNKKIKELEITIFVSMSEEQVLKKIEDAIGKFFHHKQIGFSSFELSSFAVVRDVFTKQENFLLVDVGGEVTNISMVRKNILRESITFPIGFNFLIRGVATSLGCTLAEASSMISLFEAGHAEETVAKKVSLLMDQIKIGWLKSFQDALANISNDISIPSTIYLTTDNEFADFFTQTIKAEQFNQYTLTESKFGITFLNTEILHNLATFKGPAIRDPNLIIDSIYVNRFLIDSFRSKLLEKAK